MRARAQSAVARMMRGAARPNDSGRGMRVSEVDFDVIVVGGGIAGSVCALRLAQLGHEVALVERGEAPGTKNLSGGVFYCDVMNAVLPDFATTAPVERRITRNHLAFLTSFGHVGLDAADARLGAEANACSVLRARLDPWLAEQAEDAGVAVVPGMLVDRVLTEEGRVCGVAVGDDELRSRVVVAADGINSFVARSVGLRTRQPNHELAVGVKSVFELGEDTVSSRFGLAPGEGAAWAMVGEATQGVAGGGFLYTNQSSVSVGVVLRLDSLVASGRSSAEIHDAFLAHPSVAPLIAGGTLAEYGCHMTAEAGARIDDSLVGDGIVVVGDAAGLTLNTGFAIRGMDLAAGSALCAAEAVSDALGTGDLTRAGLASYLERLRGDFVGRDVATYANAPDFFADDDLYTSVGPTLSDLLYRIYRHDTTPREPVRHLASQALRASDLPVSHWAKLAWKGGRAL